MRLLGRRSLVGDYEDIDIGRKLVEPVDKRLFSENRGVGRAFADNDLCRAAHPCVLGYLCCGVIALKSRDLCTKPVGKPEVFLEPGLCPGIVLMKIRRHDIQSRQISAVGLRHFCCGLYDPDIRRCAGQANEYLLHALTPLSVILAHRLRNEKQYFAPF